MTARRPPFLRRSSALLGRKWRLDLGEVWLTHPFRDRLAELDATWAPLRAHDAVSAHWEWARIHDQCDVGEVFALHGALHGADTNEVLALWAAEKARPRQLLTKLAYRIDWLEVHPRLRGGGVGGFMLGLVACRAIEHGADLVVYGSHPDATVIAFHEKMGAVRDAPGWSAPPNLVPFSLSRDLLEELATKTHEREI